MDDVFLAEYTASYTLPHGFSNTLLGSGHLNADGHRMVAETLYEVVLSNEATAGLEGVAA